MNISLDVSKEQLSKLRNGHGIRISPTMLGSGVEMIIDPMTYHNIEKHMKKGKGIVIKMGSNEIEMNKWRGLGCLLVLVINQVIVVVLRKQVNGLGMPMIPQEWVLILLNMDMINIKRQQTQFKVALKRCKLALKRCLGLEIWRGVCYQWRISKKSYN